MQASRWMQTVMRGPPLRLRTYRTRQDECQWDYR